MNFATSNVGNKTNESRNLMMAAEDWEWSLIKKKLIGIGEQTCKKEGKFANTEKHRRKSKSVLYGEVQQNSTKWSPMVHLRNLLI